MAIHSGYSDGYHKAAIDITKHLVENLDKEQGDILQLLMNTPHKSYIQMYTDAIYSNDEKNQKPKQNILLKKVQMNNISINQAMRWAWQYLLQLF